MSPSGGSALIYGLGAVLLILLLVWGGIYLLELYWQRRIESLSRGVVPGFNHVQSECKQIIAATRQYSHNDPLPYGPLSASISRKLDQIANQLVNLKRDYIQLQERQGKMRFRSWQRLLSAPFYWYEWYRMKSSVSGVLNGISRLEAEIKTAWEGVHSIDRQAWLVAQDARETLDLERRVRQLMETLGDRKLTGERFEEAAAMEEKVIDALDLIPRYFFTLDENNINQHATKESVCNVHAIVAEVRPHLIDLLGQLSTWDKQYKFLELKIMRLNVQIERTQNLVSTVPEHLKLPAQREQIIAMKTVAGALAETMTRLEVDSIPDVEGEVDRVEKSIAEMGSNIRRGLRQYAALSSMIINIQRIQKAVSGQISSLSKNEVHPIIWDQSRSTFREINKQIASLGEAGQARPVEDIDANFGKATEITSSLNQLSQHCQKIADQHAELLVVLEREEILQGLEWGEHAEEIAKEAAVFSPENWSKTESVATLEEDIRFLISKHQSIVPRNQSQSIKESELPAMLSEIKTLESEYKTARIRVEKVRERLRWIQSVDKETEDQFHAARNQFHQISWLVNSNQFLKKAAGSDLERLRGSLDRHHQNIDQKRTGLIEKKARDASAAIEEVTTSVNRWLALLNKDIRSKQRILAEKLNKLQEYANLEDPTIDKARRLLAKEAERAAGELDAPALSLPLEGVVAEMQQRSNSWQDYVAVEQELEEVIETPLTDAVQNAQKQRQVALELLAVANRQIPAEPAWPPTDVTVSSERRNIEQMEAQWKALKSQPVRAIWAVRRYGELAAGYQAHAGKIEQAIHWASQEQKRVIDVEVEIERLLRYLQRQELANATDPQMAEKYNQIRSRASLALEDLKEEWLLGSGNNRPNLSYDGVVQGLLDILNRLKAAVQDNQA